MARHCHKNEIKKKPGDDLKLTHSAAGTSGKIAVAEATETDADNGDDARSGCRCPGQG
jgi:hypothetical protein